MQFNCTEKFLIIFILVMTQGSFVASTGTNTTIPHFSNNMFHGVNPLQFTVRQIQGFSFNVIVS